MRATRSPVIFDLHPVLEHVPPVECPAPSAPCTHSAGSPVVVTVLFVRSWCPPLFRGSRKAAKPSFDFKTEMPMRRARVDRKREKESEREEEKEKRERWKRGGSG